MAAALPSNCYHSAVTVPVNTYRLCIQKAMDRNSFSKNRGKVFLAEWLKGWFLCIFLPYGDTFHCVFVCLQCDSVMLFTD